MANLEIAINTEAEVTGLKTDLLGLYTDIKTRKEVYNTLCQALDLSKSITNQHLDGYIENHLNEITDRMEKLVQATLVDIRECLLQIDGLFAKYYSKEYGGEPVYKVQLRCDNFDIEEDDLPEPLELPEDFFYEWMQILFDDLDKLPLDVLEYEWKFNN